MLFISCSRPIKRHSDVTALTDRTIIATSKTGFTAMHINSNIAYKLQDIHCNHCKTINKSVLQTLSLNPVTSNNHHARSRRPRLPAAISPPRVGLPPAAPEMDGDVSRGSSLPPPPTPNSPQMPSMPGTLTPLSSAHLTSIFSPFLLSSLSSTRFLR